MLQRGAIGIDPGQTGGVARIAPDGSIRIIRGERYHGQTLDHAGAVAALELVGATRGDLVFLEALGIRPRNGVRSTRTAAVSWAAWHGACSVLGLVCAVRSTVSMDRAAGLPRHPPGRKARKACVCRWASERYPDLDLTRARGSVHDGLADALLFATAAQSSLVQVAG
jgi:hypothetical protein